MCYGNFMKNICLNWPCFYPGLFTFGNAELLLHLSNGSTIYYEALPQSFDGNNITFGQLDGQMILPSTSLDSRGRFVWIPDETSSFEMEVTLIAAMKGSPLAILVYSGKFHPPAKFILSTWPNYFSEICRW